MPLVKECNIAAYRENIRLEIKAGKTPEQAAAIAIKTVKAACEKEGQPLPEELLSRESDKPVVRRPDVEPVDKAQKEKTREYLEAALEKAKELLPTWMYVVLHRAALPSSGGRAAVNRRRMSAMEKTWLFGQSSLSEKELHQYEAEISEVFKTCGRKHGTLLPNHKCPESSQVKASTFPPSDDIKTAVAKEIPIPAAPPVVFEVIEVIEGGAVCCLEEGEASTTIATSLDVCPGDMLAVDLVSKEVSFSDDINPSTKEEADQIAAYVDDVEKAQDILPCEGPRDAPLLFIGSSPSALERARRKPLVGLDAQVFVEKYLSPLGMTMDDIAMGFAVPIQYEDQPDYETIDLWRDRLLKEVARFPRCQVVALGRVAKAALGPLAACTLPHPAAIRRHGDTGEVGRKLRSLSKRLDVGSEMSE
jgi:uracil-DNA glycosylase